LWAPRSAFACAYWRSIAAGNCRARAQDLTKSERSLFDFQQQQRGFNRERLTAGVHRHFIDDSDNPLTRPNAKIQKWTERDSELTRSQS
jgi:hypothetical protein